MEKEPDARATAGAPPRFAFPPDLLAEVAAGIEHAAAAGARLAAVAAPEAEPLPVVRLPVPQEDEA